MLTNTPILTVRHPAPEISVIEIQGEINAHAANQIMEAYSQAEGPDVRAILLNFERMDYMNSSGIGLLITLLIKANRQNQHLAAVGLNPHFQRIFELTRLREAIPTYHTEREALAGMQKIVGL
jgi:anti-sigma B factor antagonist